MEKRNYQVISTYSNALITPSHSVTTYHCINTKDTELFIDTYKNVRIVFPYFPPGFVGITLL